MSPVYPSLWEAGRQAKAKLGPAWHDRVRLVEVAGGWSWEKRRRW